jgi:hypothetical protein
VKGAQKITFGEMREMGVRGVLVAATTIAATGPRSAGIHGRMMFGYLTSSTALRAKLAAPKALISARTSIGKKPTSRAAVGVLRR